MDDFEVAKDKVLMGTERESMIISDDEKRATAYHEAGHALVAILLPGRRPAPQGDDHPPGPALGVTMQLPVDDRHTYSKEYLESTIAVLMGGRVAEEIKLDQLTTGAGNDFERATDMARKMVTRVGHVRALGPLTFGKKEEQIFLGREISQHRDYSEATAIEIDREVKSIVVSCYDDARRILEENIRCTGRHRRGPAGTGSDRRQRGRDPRQGRLPPNPGRGQDRGRGRSHGDEGFRFS